jgi:molecular chaperone DnaK
MARDNKSLGRFHLGGIPPAPARVPQIEVTFDIDANGILNVAAQEKGTGQKQAITITGSGNLTRDEIERMVREAEMNADQDRQIQELAELKNKADALASQTEKTLKDAGDKVDEATRQSATEKIEAVRKAVQNGTEVEIREAFNALEQLSHSIAEKLYAQSGDQGAPAQDGPQEGDVIDSEFKEEK